jgi:hypothetical protein
MCKCIEYPYFLYLVVRSVRCVSNTGKQIHLLVYLLMYRLYIVHVVNNVSHYEYLATCIDDILIFRNDPMAIIKFLEEIYF